MADQSSDLTRKILVDVELKADQVKADLPLLVRNIDELAEAQKRLEKEGKKGSQMWVENAQDLRQLKVELRESNKYIDNVTKALNAESGSIAQNRALLSLTTEEYVKLGQNIGLTAPQVTRMGDNIKSLTERLKDQEKAIGQTYRNVGNYTDGINASNVATAGAGKGLQVFSSGIENVRKGIGFMPQEIKAATSALGVLPQIGVTAFTSLQTAVTGFSTTIKDYKQIQIDATKAAIADVQAKEILKEATEANTVAQAALAAGTIEAVEAEAAATAQAEAQTAATTVNAAATSLATAATNSWSVALSILKIAIASTGIGLLILALGSLIAYIENTNEGSKRFKVVLAEIGVLVDDVTKILAPFGKALVEVFANAEGPIKVVMLSLSQFINLLNLAVRPAITLGKVLYDVFSGNFKKAVQDGIEGVKSWGNSIATLATNVPKLYKAVGTTAVDLAKGIAKATEEVDKQGVSFKNTSEYAGYLTKRQQALTKTERLWSEEKVKQQGILDVLKLKIRDQSLTEDQRVQAAKDAKAISDTIFKSDLKNAQENLRIVQGQQSLKSKVDFQAVTDAKNRVQQIKNSHEVELQSIQNRQARVEKMQDNADKKAAAAAEKRRDQEKKALNDTEQIMRESAARELMDLYEAYGDQAIAANSQYERDLNKLKQFREKRLITQQAYNAAEAQLKGEYEGKIAAIIQTFQKEDLARFKQSQNELIDLQNSNIKESTRRQLAQINQAGTEKLEALDKQDAEAQENVKRLNREIAVLEGSAKAEAEERRLSELSLIQLNGYKRIQIEKKTAAQIEKVKQEERNRIISNFDNAAVDDTNRPGQEAAHFEALRTQLEHEREIVLANKDLTNDQVIAKTADLNRRLAELEQNENGRRYAQFEQYENLVQSAAFNILSNGLQAASEKKIKQLSNDKDAALENTNLRGGQIKAIEQKYAKLEEQEKKRAFKKNQVLQVGNAFINGAVGAGKTIAELGLPAALPFLPYIAGQTIASIATILAQKPGFDKGGQFTSDGRGAVLPGYSRTDNTNAYLRSGEAVIVSEAARDPQTRSLLSAINVAYGGRSFAAGAGTFTKGQGAAIGGIYTDGGNANRYYAQPVINQQSLANTIAYQLVNNMPPIYVDVKDINNQQGVLARTVDRVTL